MPTPFAPPSVFFSVFNPNCCFSSCLSMAPTAHLFHIGDNLVKDAHLGAEQNYADSFPSSGASCAQSALHRHKFLQPAQRRDRIFGTYQEEDRSLKIDYGINRKTNSGSFLDVYFGEFVALGRDFTGGAGLRNKLLYLLMPPGWHRAASTIRLRIQRAVSEHRRTGNLTLNEENPQHESTKNRNDEHKQLWPIHRGMRDALRRGGRSG